MSSFKQQHSFEKRKAESTRILTRYPTRVPVIVDDASSSAPLMLEKKKLVVPNNLTVGQLLFVLRKRIKLLPEKAIFLFLDNSSLPAAGILVSQLYKEHKDQDGFLYFTCSNESTFGNHNLN